MSELKMRLQEDAKHALKSGEQIKRLVLSMLLTFIHNKEIEKRTKLSKEGIVANLERVSELTDEEIILSIFSEVKKRKEAIEMFKKGNREELAVKEKDELSILESYLPEQLSEDKVRDIVRKIIVETGAKDIKEMGKIIGAVMGKTRGQADGQMVSKIVKEELNI